jgi:hypothetical protein
MVTNVPGNQPGNAPEDHGSRLLNGFQTLATVSSCGRPFDAKGKISVDTAFYRFIMILIR